MVIACSGLALEAQERTDIERGGLFSRIFNKDAQTKNPGPGYNEKVHGVYMDRETDTVSSLVIEPPRNPAGRENDPVERYPEIPGYLTIKNTSQKAIEDLVAKIYAAYEGRINRMDPPDLRTSRTRAMGNVPAEFPTAWRGRVADPVWHDQLTVSHSVEDIYQRALQHSNQIKIYSDLPLIRETGMQEADGEFDINTFIDGRLTRTNEPIGSTLTTGNNANRFRENRDYVEGGVRKMERFFGQGAAQHFGRQHLEKGGVTSLSSWFKSFAINGDMDSRIIDFNVFQAGLMFSFAMEGGDESATKALGAVTEAARAGDAKKLAKAVEALQTTLIEKQDAIRDHLRKLVNG